MARLTKSDQMLQDGFVYFIQHGADHYVKIGWAGNVLRRLGELEKSTPHARSFRTVVAGAGRNGWVGAEMTYRKENRHNPT